MSLKRKRHRATLLLDGMVLITAGAATSNSGGGGGGPSDTAEIYDPISASFSDVANMHIGRAEHDATLLVDGTVLVTGGTSDRTSPADVYQPASRSFTAVGEMLDTPSRHVALRLTNRKWKALTGKVLIVGGAVTGGTVFGGAEQALDSVQLYDPATGTFSLFGTMTVARQNHTATELPDGRILITGGVGRPFISKTAEVLRP